MLTCTEDNYWLYPELHVLLGYLAHVHAKGTRPFFPLQPGYEATPVCKAVTTVRCDQTVKTLYRGWPSGVAKL